MQNGYARASASGGNRKSAARRGARRVFVVLCVCVVGKAVLIVTVIACSFVLSLASFDLWRARVRKHRDSSLQLLFIVPKNLSSHRHVVKMIRFTSDSFAMGAHWRHTTPVCRALYILIHSLSPEICQQERAPLTPRFRVQIHDIHWGHTAHPALPAHPPLKLISPPSLVTHHAHAQRQPQRTRSSKPPPLAHTHREDFSFL